MRVRRVLVSLLAVSALLAAPAIARAVTGFSGPVFGISATPNGNVLVADAGFGIVELRGEKVVDQIALPGASDVSWATGNTMWATTGAGADPTQDTGQGLWLVNKGVPELVVNLYEFETANNPDGNDPFDSNPFDVQAINPRSALVVDAGANALLKVNRQGDVDVMAVFPDEVVSTANIKDMAGCPDSGADFCFLPDEMPAQPVPTSIAVGRDGSIYVGELKGFPGPTGESNIWRVDGGASGAVCGESPDCVKVFDGGFTSVIDLAFGPNGDLFVVEMDEASWAAVEIFLDGLGGTVNSCDLATLECQEVETGIPMLTSIAFGKGGSLWATQNVLVPGGAEVVRLR